MTDKSKIPHKHTSSSQNGISGTNIYTRRLMLMLAAVDTTWPSFRFVFLNFISGVAPGDVRPPCDIQVLLFPSG